MICGLIGAKLPHSFSKQIHESLGGYSYELIELSERELEPFLQKRAFSGVNVTIPYKEAVRPFLDEVDPQAAAIGAVNTIVNRNGRLIGYNTDFGGMRAMLLRAGIKPEGKKVLILGTGGTSKTAEAVCRSLGAGEIHKVSRTGKNGALTYEQACRQHSDAGIILNTTPVGMYPNLNETPVSLAQFPALCGLVDVIYNPLQTKLLAQNWQNSHLRRVGGLYMLVRQAVLAYEMFSGKQADPLLTETIYAKLLRQKQNLVLIGMPGCGKTTVAGILAQKTGRPVFDLDLEIEKRAGIPIRQIFAERGETAFRDLETQVIRDLAGQTSVILSTGGGAILRRDNVTALKQNGRLFFLDRPLEALIPTDDRPLGDSREKLTALYESRYDQYLAACDERVLVTAGPEQTAEAILRV